MTRPKYLYALGVDLGVNVVPVLVSSELAPVTAKTSDHDVPLFEPYN